LGAPSTRRVERRHVAQVRRVEGAPKEAETAIFHREILR
jgi:hypothetical protein